MTDGASGVSLLIAVVGGVWHVPRVVCCADAREPLTARLKRFAGDWSGAGGVSSVNICVYTFTYVRRTVAASVYN